MCALYVLQMRFAFHFFAFLFGFFLLSFHIFSSFHQSEHEQSDFSFFSFISHFFPAAPLFLCHMLFDHFHQRRKLCTGKFTFMPITIVRLLNLIETLIKFLPSTKQEIIVFRVHFNNFFVVSFSVNFVPLPFAIATLNAQRFLYEIIIRLAFVNKRTWASMYQQQINIQMNNNKIQNVNESKMSKQNGEIMGKHSKIILILHEIPNKNIASSLQAYIMQKIEAMKICLNTFFDLYTFEFYKCKACIRSRVSNKKVYIHSRQQKQHQQQQTKLVMKSSVLLMPAPLII